jgi:hypothetical protein
MPLLDSRILLSGQGVVIHQEDWDSTFYKGGSGGMSGKMISKTYTPSQTGGRVKVTFTVPGSIWANRIELAIAKKDDLIIQPLYLARTGDWTLTLDLPVGQVYRFNYLCDEKQWMNDGNADGYERNLRDGSFICLLNTGAACDPLGAQASLSTLAAPVAILEAAAEGRQ